MYKSVPVKVVRRGVNTHIWLWRHLNGLSAKNEIQFIVLAYDAYCGNLLNAHTRAELTTTCRAFVGPRQSQQSKYKTFRLDAD